MSGPPPYVPAPAPSREEFRHYSGPQPSRTLAGWALGLSIFPCLAGWVVSVVFACITMSRPPTAGSWGRGYAIASLVIVGAWLLAAVGFFAYALSLSASLSAEREDGVIVEGGTLGIFELTIGDCFDFPGGRSGDLMAAIVSTTSPTISSVDAVPCTEPHDAEVYADFDLPDGVYPGEASVERRAENGCAHRFQSFVGLAYDDSVLEMYLFHPGETSWKNIDDREVVCAIMEPSGKTTADTLRGASR